MKEKNFKFRKSFGKVVGQMTDKQAGEFIKAVSGYVFDGKPMESKDEYLKGVFVYVQNVLDTEKRDRENGKLGGAVIAERYKEAQRGFVTEEKIVSQLIIVSSDNGNGAVADTVRNNPKPPKKTDGRPETVNACGGIKFPNPKQGGWKTV